MCNFECSLLVERDMQSVFFIFIFFLTLFNLDLLKYFLHVLFKKIKKTKVQNILLKFGNFWILYPKVLEFEFY